jgi:hypothetical protein
MNETSSRKPTDITDVTNCRKSVYMPNLHIYSSKMLAAWIELRGAEKLDVSENRAFWGKRCHLRRTRTVIKSHVGQILQVHNEKFHHLQVHR